MKAPDKIYIYDNAGGNSYSISPTDNIADKKHEIEYIRKDALLEWAEEEQAKCSSETHPYAMFMNVVIDKLNSM